MSQMKKRIENRQKSRKKGPIDIHDKSSSFNEDLEYNRPQKHHEEKKNRLKHGILHI